MRVLEISMRANKREESVLRVSRPPCAERRISAEGSARRKKIRLRRLAGMLVFCIIGVLGCDLVPPKPEAVFVLYRDRMKAGKLDEARSLLSEKSRDLVNDLVSQYQLRHPPENLALLNILDPVTSPVAVKVGQTRALLRVRTLKGGLRLIRLERKTPDAPWSVDLAEELKSFESFLRVRAALETIREQAGEYAATLKAFEDRMRGMKVPHQPQKPR